MPIGFVGFGVALYYRGYVKSGWMFGLLGALCGDLCVDQSDVIRACDTQ